MEEIDIWRSANLLIQQHGPQAIVEATKRFVELDNGGDDEGAAVWLRIISAVNQLMRQSPDNGGKVS
jgi:hypothetical protein